MHVARPVRKRVTGTSCLLMLLLENPIHPSFNHCLRHLWLVMWRLQARMKGLAQHSVQHHLSTLSSCCAQSAHASSPKRPIFDTVMSNS